MSPPFGFVEYRSFDRFEQDYIEEIQEQCVQLARDFQWWGEWVHLYDKIAYPLYLTGDSHLLRSGLRNELDLQPPIEPGDDAFMALGDYQKLLEVLSILSKEHEFSWKLFVTYPRAYEDVIGTIENGEVSPSAIQHMTRVLEEFQLTHKELLNQDRRRAIFSKYEDDPEEKTF